MDCLVEWCKEKDAELIVIVGQTYKVYLFCIVLTHVVSFPLAVFSQLSLEARGIATKGMRHGLLGGMADD